jgi:glycosyltransferase involved in cell wall biosynthesis
VGTIAGVKLVGEIPRAADLLQEIAVTAFPCPNTSGPKVKVIESLAYGVPVVTTPAGIEGVAVEEGGGAVVADSERFAAALAETLADPEGRAHLSRMGRAAVVAAHGPKGAAQARLAALNTIPSG